MNTTEYFKRTIQAYLEERAMEDELFAAKYDNPDKNIDDCVTYIFYVHNNNLLILKQKYKKYSKTHKIVRLFNIKPNNYYSNKSRYSIFLLRSMEGTIFPFHLLKST